MHDCFRLLRYARHQAGSLVLISVLTLLATGLLALQPWPVKLLIDHILGAEPLPRTLAGACELLHLPSTPQALLLAIVLAGVLLWLLNSAVDTALAWIWTKAGRRMVFDLSQDLFARLQLRSLAFHKRTPVGDVLSRVTVDSWCAYQCVDSLLVAPFHALVTTAWMILLMAQLDLQLTLFAVGIAPFMVVASFLLGGPLRAAARLKREIESRIQAHIQQTLTGIPVVQAFAQEGRENLRFQTFASTAIRTQKQTALLGSVNSLSSGLITTVGSGLILWLGARQVIEGALSIGSILVFLAYLNSLQGQIKVLAGWYTTAQNLSASARRVAAVLETPPEIMEAADALPLSRAGGEVRFERVIFGYAPDRPVLHDITLTVRPGETVALVGATGAGKTSLVSLVPRFADPWEGRVLLDGRDLRELQLRSVRDQVALVLQESCLLPVTIAENIAYGRPDATAAEIQAAAEAAHAHGFIARLPEGYDTVVGEHGATLSGGERQRLAIARALLKDPAILILDEPTSALDAETERLIFEALHHLMAGRTAFVIAHRLSTIRRADRIVVLREGRIVEVGHHAELVAKGGCYAEMLRAGDPVGLPAGREGAKA